MEITSIGSFIDFQDKVRARTDKLLSVVPPDRLDFAYLAGKFTIGVTTPPMFGLTAEEVQKASTPP